MCKGGEVVRQNQCLKFQQCKVEGSQSRVGTTETNVEINNGIEAICHSLALACI